MTTLAHPDDNDFTRDQSVSDTQPLLVSGEPAPTPNQRCNDAHAVPVGGGSDSPASQGLLDHHAIFAGRGPILLDETLLVYAAMLDDLEKTRMANENRLRTLTRHRFEPVGSGNQCSRCGKTSAAKDANHLTDAPGDIGFEMTTDHPDVKRLADMVDAIHALEHGAELNLKRAMRAHPLGAWVASRIGVGEKQAARLLAAVGDPYWNTLHNRPRTFSELRAFSGLHPVPAAGVHASPGDQPPPDTTPTSQDALPTAASSGSSFAPGSHVAARRRKGQQANWSSDAKMRAYLIAESCIKQKARSPFRVFYDDRRARTAVTHPDWTPGHSHNDAMRITAQEVLKDLWRAARDIHTTPTPGEEA